jgi:ribosomal protein L19
MFSSLRAHFLRKTSQLSLLNKNVVKTYIERKEKRNSLFEKHFNPYHIYPLGKNTKKTQSKFDDPNYKWERLPAPIKEDGKQLLKLLEKEELKNIKSVGLRRDDITVGDKIEVEYYHSITSKKLYKYKGVVVAVSRQNSLTRTFKFLSQISGTYVVLLYPYWSPMLHSIKLTHKGNFGVRRKIINVRRLNHFGGKLDEIFKGGRGMNLNKKTRQNIRKLDFTKSGGQL